MNRTAVKSTWTPLLVSPAANRFPRASTATALAWSDTWSKSVEELTKTIAELVPRIAKHGTFNFLLSNGQALWAHASTKLHYVLRQHPFTEVRLKDENITVNLAELNGPEDRLAIVVTEPLTTNENWVAMAPGEIKVFVDGSPLP